MRQQEKIAVIIPTYNRADLIGRAVRSVLDQTYTNLEVIVVDDGSTDDTEARVRSIQDERLRYYRQENAGQSAARNNGVEQASAELIAFQDSDDAWHPDKLEKQMKYWAEHPECGLIYCALRCFQTDGTIMKIPPAPEEGEVFEGNIFRTLLGRNTVDTTTMLFRKEYFIQVGGFDTALRALEDWDLALRMSEHWKFGYVDEMLNDSYMLADGISSRVGGFFHARCKMIGRYKSVMLELGIFDRVVEKLLAQAIVDGIQNQVQQMLVLALQGQL